MQYTNSQGSELKDRIFNYILRNIQNGTFMPGSRLNEEIIAKELSVSRTPVREVLTHLAAEGAIEKRPRKGFFVRVWSKQEKMETYEVIAYLEFLCAKKSLEYLTDKDFLKMKEYIVKMNVAIEFKNFAEYVELQSQFHYTYINKCENHVLIKSIMDLFNTTMPITYSPESMENEDFSATFGENNRQHQEILDALMAKDLPRLENVITRHWTLYEADFI